MKRQPISPYFTSFLIRVGSAVLAVAQTTILARVLGPNELGVYSALLSLTTLLALPVAAGIPTYLTREVARARANDEMNKIRPLLRAGNRAVGLLALAASFVLMGMFLLGFLPTNRWGDVIPLMLIIPLLGWDLIRSGSMRGLNSALASQIPENIIRPFVLLVVLIVALYAFGTFSAQAAMYAFAVACLGSFVAGQVLLRRLLPPVSTSSSSIAIFTVLRENVGLALLGGSKTILANLDILVLAALGAYAVAGAYKVALQGVVLLLMVLNAVYAVAMRDLASSLALKDVQKTVHQSDRATVFASVGTLCGWVMILVFGQWVISVFFGVEFRDAYAILLVLGVGHIINAATGPAMEILVMLDGQRDALLANLLSIVVLLIGAYAASSFLPILGIAVASATSNCVRNVLMAGSVRNRLGFDPSIIGVIRRHFSK